MRGESGPFALICLLISLWTLFPFASWKITDSASKIWVLRSLYMAAAAVPAAFALLIFSVLEKKDNSARLALRIFWILTALFFILGFSNRMIRDTVVVDGLHGIEPGIAFHFFVGYFIFACGYTFLHLFRGLAKSSGYRRNQLRYYLIGFLLAYFSGALHFLSMYLHKEPVPHDLFVIAFISVLAYAIVKHRVMDVNLAARYAMVQIVFGLLIGAPLAVIAAWAGHPVVIVGTILLLAMGAPTAFGSMRGALTEAVDRLPLFQGRYERFSSLQAHLDRLSVVRTLQEWANQIVKIAFDLYRSKTISLLLRDPHKKRFIVKASQGFNHASAVFMSLSMDGALAKHLALTQNILIAETALNAFQKNNIDEVEGDLKFLQAAILVPIINSGEVYGILVLGEKAKTGAYNELELTSLSALSREAEHALQVILSGLSQEQTTAVWAHDLVKPFTVKGSFRILDDLLSGGFGPVSETLKTNMKLVLEDMKFVRDNLLQLLNPGKGIEYNIRPIPVAEFYSRTRDRFALQADKQGVRWAVNVPPDNVRVFCDSAMIEHRVISNLVENAFRYTPHGGKIILEHYVEDNRFVCSVSDTGPGIEENMLSRLFEPRAQGEGNNRGLAGLGLFSAKTVVEANKGKIWVKSSPGAGSTFFFDLPLASRSQV